jgi:hypothetical protein
MSHKLAHGMDRHQERRRISAPEDPGIVYRRVYTGLYSDLQGIGRQTRRRELPFGGLRRLPLPHWWLHEVVHVVGSAAPVYFMLVEPPALRAAADPVQVDRQCACKQNPK